MPRTVAASTLTAQTGTPRRRTAAAGDDTAARTGVTRPTLANTPGREKQRAGGTGSRRPVGKGWADFNKARAERSDKYKRFEATDEPQIIAFAEPEPFAFIYRHWVAKRPYTCLGEDCPLCEAGDRARPVVFYNIIDLADLEVKVWEMSADPTRKVQKHYDLLVAKEQTLADADKYWAVHKDKKDNNAYDYSVAAVKARDLEEDWRTEPLGDDERAECMAKLYTDEVVYVSTRSDLAEAVEKLED